MGHIEKESILFTIARDISDLNEKINSVRNELNSMRIPLDAWLIECDNRLFSITMNYELDDKVNAVTRYAIEPILDFDYCCQVLSAIYTLASSIFGRSFHTYDEILNYMREDSRNIKKTELAVRRLSNLFHDQEDPVFHIYYDSSGWRVEDFRINGNQILNTYIDQSGFSKHLDTLISFLEKRLGINDK